MSSSVGRGLVEHRLPRGLTGLILLAYLVVEASVIWTTVSPARDGGRYVTYAKRLMEEPWSEVLETSIDHPGYPVLLWGAFELGAIVGLEQPIHRVRLAQTVSVLAGLAFLIGAAIYLRRVHGDLVACCGLAALAFLPRPAWLLADVLSDPTYAAFWMLAAAALVTGLETRRTLPFAVAGLLGALAYFVRVDALTLPATLGATLFASWLFQEPLASARGASQSSDSPRQAWTLLRGLGVACLFLVAFSTAIAGFFLIYGKLSPKPIANVLFGGVLRAPFGGSDFSEALLAAALIPVEERSALTAAYRYLKVIGQQVQFAHLGIAGLALAADTLRRRLDPSHIFSATTFFLFFALFVTLELAVGYADGRYLLPVLPVLVGYSMQGALQLGARVLASATVGPILLLLVSLMFSLPSLTKRNLHESHAELLAAGAWLEKRLDEEDSVFDLYFWPTYLRGLSEQRSTSPEPPDETGQHFLLVRVGDLAAEPRIRQLIESGRTETVFEIHDPGGRQRRAVRILKVRR